MGPAAAYNALSDPGVARVTLCDASQEQLAAAHKKLVPLAGGAKLRTVALNLADETAAVRLLEAHDVAIAALPKAAIPFGIRAAAAARTPLVDLSWPVEAEVAALRREVEEAGSLLIPGCGVEPGLTEIMARYLV